MGSLMAGWNSDPKAVSYMRNISLTKGEIDAYWQSKKRTEEEHLRAISSLGESSHASQKESKYEGSEARIQRSYSLPLPERSRGRSLGNDSMTDLEKMRKPNAWWTRSNCAFLNEPPVTAMDGPSYKYASQYHLTGLGHQIIKDCSEIGTSESRNFTKVN